MLISVAAFTHTVTVWTQHVAQIELGSAYVAVHPRACVKVGSRTQCERSFTLQTE